MILLSQRPLGTSDADNRLFVGRACELARAHRALQLSLNVYVCGPPGIGRTTFLRQIQRDKSEARYVNLGRFDSQQEQLDAVEAALTSTGTLVRPNKNFMGMNRNPNIFDRTTIRRVEDPLKYLRGAAHRTIESSQSAEGVSQSDKSEIDATHSTERQLRHILLVDDLTREGCQQLFGRLRDSMWEIPICWVVAGTTPYLEPPEDSFFDVQLELPLFDKEALQHLAIRRADTGTAGERSAINQAARSAFASIGSCTPRHALSVLRDVYLSDDITEASLRIAQLQSSRAHLSPTAVRILDALETHGPTHAGNEALLATVGVTRSRVVQLLAELEKDGLVSAQRVGRRKLYIASREVPATTNPSDTTTTTEDDDEHTSKKSRLQSRGVSDETAAGICR